MLFWRCLVIVLLFWLALIVVSCSQMVKADAFFQGKSVDHRAELFFLCVDRLQLDIELGLRPEMSDQQALAICSERTESIMQGLSAQGLELNPYEAEVGF